MAGERKRDIIQAGDARIEVITEGSGPLLVMVPSSSRDSEDFDDVAAMLAAAGLRVLRPQPGGMGRSTGPLAGLTLHDYARDVAVVIEHQRAGPAVVLGHAFGQWVARTLATDRPDLVRGVVLAAAAVKSTNRTCAPHWPNASIKACQTTSAAPRCASPSSLRGTSRRQAGCRAGRWRQARASARQVPRRRSRSGGTPAQRRFWTCRARRIRGAHARPSTIFAVT